ncbi:MAG: hypothetical protein ACKOX6_14145 [Bdellovibrio sp.]
MAMISVSYGSLSLANSNGQALVEFLETTKKLNLNLEKINKGQTNCDISAEPLQCNSASICSKLDNDGLYIYKNEKGQKQPNAAMVVASYNYSACGSGMRGFHDDDPFVYFEKFLDANEAGGQKNLERNQQQFNQAMAQAEKTFADVKVHFLKAMDNRKNSTNTAQIENLKKRIQSVKFFKYSLADITSQNIAVDCETPNAYYKTETNRVMICPQMLNNPDGTLFHLLAHELGHSMDSCNIAMDLQSGISYPAEMAGPPTSGPVISKGLSPQENPYGSAYQCLSSEKVISLPKQTKDEVARMFDTHLKNNPTETKEMLSKMEWVKENYDKYSDCNYISGGHEQEASADWLATEAVAEKLKTFQDSHAKKQFGFEATLGSGSMCPAMNEKALNTLRSAKGNLNCKNITDHIRYIEQHEEDFSESHPAPQERINNIILANPEMQKALDCKGKPQAPYCGRGI